MKKISSNKTKKWEIENLPLLASFVIIVACFIVTLTKLSTIKPETLLPKPTPVCTESPDTFSGIGARLEQIKDKVYIQEIILGSPAEINKILPGDVIYRVDDTPVVGVEDAVSRIRGIAGSSVRLILYRGNLRLDKTMVRENIVDEKTTICK